MIVRFPNLLHLLCFMLVAEACKVMIVRFPNLLHLLCFMLVAEACKVMIFRFPNLLHFLCFMLVAEACKVMIVCNRRRRCVTGQIRRALVNQRPDTRLGH